MKVLITLLTEKPSGKQFAEKQIDEVSAYGTFQYCAQQEAAENAQEGVTDDGIE